MVPNARLQRTGMRLPLSRKPFGDQLQPCIAVAIVLATALPSLAAQPTPVRHSKTIQPVLLEKPLPDPGEVRKRCGSQPLAPPIFEAELRADGLVGAVKFKRVTGCPAADELLEQSVKRWKFKPALQDGKPIPTWLTMVINHLAGE